MASKNQVARIAPQVLPSPEELYEEAGGEEAGGNITHQQVWWRPPQEWQHSNTASDFHEVYPAFEPIFYKLVNSDDSLFQEALNYFIHLTTTLQSLW